MKENALGKPPGRGEGLTHRNQQQGTHTHRSLACSKHLNAHITLLTGPKVGTVMVPIFQMRKLRG